MALNSGDFPPNNQKYLKSVLIQVCQKFNPSLEPKDHGNVSYDFSNCIYIYANLESRKEIRNLYRQKSSAS